MSEQKNGYIRWQVFWGVIGTIIIMITGLLGFVYSVDSKTDENTGDIKVLNSQYNNILKTLEEIKQDIKELK